MCYLCPSTQTAKARRTAKVINEALRIWGQKDPDNGAGYGARFRRSWGYRHDWTRPPKGPTKLPRVPLGTETLGDGLWTDAELREPTP